MCAFALQLHPLSFTYTHTGKHGKGLQWRDFKWKIDGQQLWGQITLYTCFALHDFLLLFLVTVDNKNCYKTLLTRKQNTDGMLNVKHLGMAINCGLKSYFVPSQFSWEVGKGRQEMLRELLEEWALPATKKLSVCWKWLDLRRDSGFQECFGANAQCYYPLISWGPGWESHL